MSLSIDQVRAKVASQKTLLPALYGAVDFDAAPERFTLRVGPVDPATHHGEAHT